MGLVAENSLLLRIDFEGENLGGSGLTRFTGFTILFAYRIPKTEWEL